MSRVFRVLLIILLIQLMPTSFAHAQRSAAQVPMITQSLADIGYGSDVALSATQAAADFTFPLPEGGISQAMLTLKVTLSQALDPTSTLQVFLNSRPNVSFFVNKLGSDGTLMIPLPPISEPFLHVRILGNFVTGTARCLTAASDALWMLVASTSHLDYPYNLDQASIKDFLHLPGGQVVVRGLWDTSQHQADSIGLFSALTHLYRSTPTHIALAEDALAPAANSLQREIVLNADANAAPLRLDGNMLTVAAGQQAINELIARVDQPLLLGRTLLTLAAPTPHETDATVQQLTLAQLGLTDQERSGIGELPISTRFTLADVGGWPHNLRFNLSSSFDQTATDTTERTLLRIRLNGTLLETHDLRGISTLQRAIDLPTDLLKAENYLETTFVYAKESGDCQGSPYAFTGQLHATSSFTWDGYEAGRGRLPELIGTFTGAGDLYLPNGTPETARAAARLVGGLSRFTATPLLPKLTETSTLSQPSTSAYRIIIGGDSSVAQMLKLPVDVNTNLTIVDPQTGMTLVSGQSDQPLVAAQYLASGTPTLAIQASPATDEALFSATIKRLVDPQQFFKLSGDVVIGDSAQMLAFNLGNDAFEVQVSASAGLPMPVNDYRWLLVVLAAVLIGGSWWQVYNRIGKRPPLPTLPDDTQPD